MANRVEQLESEIRYHNERYHNQDAPEISDYEYDQLVKELKTLRPNSPVLKEMGQPVFGVKIAHKTPMGSLNKVHSVLELTGKIASGTDLVAMPKIDGLSLSIIYKDGKLLRAVTRGNGVEGEDVTPNALVVRNIPKRVSVQEEFEVRGEIYVDKNWFFKHMAKGFKNPRNYAAGSLKQKDAAVTSTRNLSFVGYRLLLSSDKIKSKQGELATLHNMGFEVPQFKTATTVSTIESAVKYFESQRKNFHFDIDGIVFWINENDLFEKYGFDGGTPKGAVAYKFDTEKVETEVLDIEWNTSRTGKVVPILLIKEVQCAGTSVRRVAIYNYDFLLNENVAIGDEIIIEKANEIIPKLVEVIRRTETRNYNAPLKCPTCNERLGKDGVHLVCKNTDCPAQIGSTLLNFLRKLNIKGFSVGAIQKILDSGLLDSNNIFDISIPQYKEMGFGDKSAQTLWDSLHSIKATPSEFLTSMGIDKVGSSAWESMLNEYSFDDIIDGKLSEFQYRKNMGNITGEAAFEWMSKNREKVLDLVQYVEIDEQKVQLASSLRGKTFCITGTLSKLRKEVEADILNHGGGITGVSRNLDYLVAGVDCGSKLAKAKSLGVKIISEAELYKMM